MMTTFYFPTNINITAKDDNYKNKKEKRPVHM